MNRQDLIESQKTLEGSFPLIGFVAWWSINNAFIERSELKRIFKENDLSEEFLPENITSRTAFHRAIQKMKTGEGKDYVIKEIRDRDDEVVFGVVKADADADAEELLFNPENKIRFNKVTENVSIDDPENYPNGEFEKSYEAFLNFYDSHEIRSMLLNIIQNHLMSINVRQKGGTYFLSKEHSEIVKKLSKAISQISDESSFDYLPIIDTEQTRNTMLKTFLSEIHKEMEGFRDECKLYLGKDDTRPSTLRNKLESFQKLRAKISVYEDALEYAASDLKTEIEAMTDNVKKYLFSHDLSV